MCDGILRLNLTAGATIVGFADDVAIPSVAKHIHEAETITNEAISMAQEWQNRSEHKTEAVLISSRKIVESAKIRVGEATILSKACYDRS